MRKYTIGECPLCGQGDLVVVKELIDSVLLILCDDCKCLWNNPIDAKDYNKSLERECFGSQNASLEEITKYGWHSFIKKVDEEY